MTLTELRILPCTMHERESPRHAYHKAMITFLLPNCNDFSQNVYDLAVDELPLHRIKCTCGKCGCLILYGHYSRSVKWYSKRIDLRVQRVLCKECGATHALFPDILVPYSQIPLEDQQKIIRFTEKHESPLPVLQANCLIDENNIKYILRQYRKHWKERLISIGRTLLDSLTIPCFSAYSRQFMQIHRTRNKLYTLTNTS